MTFQCILKPEDKLLQETSWCQSHKTFFLVTDEEAKTSLSAGNTKGGSIID
jgi:hypothetical protein